MYNKYSNNNNNNNFCCSPVTIRLSLLSFCHLKPRLYFRNNVAFAFSFTQYKAGRIKNCVTWSRVKFPPTNLDTLIPNKICFPSLLLLPPAGAVLSSCNYFLYLSYAPKPNRRLHALINTYLLIVIINWLRKHVMFLPFD